MKRNGFSRMIGVLPTTVFGAPGHAAVGGLPSPTKTMFQTPPVQLPQSVFLVKNCCCDPELTCPSMSESTTNPPLEKPPSARASAPFTCTRRNEVPCETAQMSTFPSCVGTTDRFSVARQ